MNHKYSTFALVMFLILGAIAGFVTAQISPSLNLNGQNRFTIQNYSEISGIGNLTVGQGINYLDIYSNGSIVVFNSSGYNVTFTDGIKWTELIVYPVACPAGSYLTTLADSVTCTAITTIPNNITVGTANTEYFKFGANTTSMTCGVSTYGSVYFDNSTQKHYGCNATGWQGMY
jgi:hypothetical protein